MIQPILHSHHQKRGMTLVELMVAMLITAIILAGTFSLLKFGSAGYKKVTHASLETASLSLTKDLISNDLDLINRSLPISIGDGKNDNGWDIMSGLYTEWENHISYGRLFPSQANSGFPCDRIGFFINLPPERTKIYNGKNIAHVLYFTAVTSDTNVEALTKPDTKKERGYSKKLYRYFTPPDRVFQRLNMLNPSPIFVPPKGAESIPRGPNFTTQQVTDDDKGWHKEEPNASILSLVTMDVIQFEISLKGHIRDISNPQSNHNIQNFSTSVYNDEMSQVWVTDQVVPYHSLLASSSPQHASWFTTTSVSFTIKQCPQSIARTLTAEKWDLNSGNNTIPDRPNTPITTSVFSKTFLN